MSLQKGATMNYSSIVNKIHEELETAGYAERKEKISGYMKTSNLAFIGVELPDIHRIVKSNIKSLKPDELPLLMEEMWAIETFETRLAGIDMMKVYAKKGPIQNALSIVDEWIDDLDTWGLSDPLCQPCIGTLLHRDSSVEETLKKWRDSDNFWRRRCSVLPYLYLCLKSNYMPEFDTRILEAVEPHIDDQEFFVGKAAGWVLRELSKRNSGLVRDYIEKNENQMTKLVLREGSKKL
ncbi:MAG: hypothetical protein GF309_10010 [Candidatus Lokiarchaeota archaeon]|nr:hypothetical protein [Candidatus Lokiarchaeota archaeon]